MSAKGGSGLQGFALGLKTASGEMKNADCEPSGIHGAIGHLVSREGAAAMKVNFP
jgi:hypothetical protein